jgi:hypothetical protein
MQPIRFRSEQSINGVKIKRLAYGGGGKNNPQRHNDGFVLYIAAQCNFVYSHMLRESAILCRLGSSALRLHHTSSCLHSLDRSRFLHGPKLLPTTSYGFPGRCRRDACPFILKSLYSCIDPSQLFGFLLFQADRCSIRRISNTSA